MAEQLALDQVVGDGRAVHRDERPRRAVAVPKNAPRDELLARAALARDHDGDVAGGDLPDRLEHFLHRRGTANNALLVVVGVQARPVVAGRPQVGAGLERRFREGEHLLRIEWLHDVVERPVLHRLNRRLGRAKGRHQDDELVRIERTDVLERFNAAHAAQAHVQEDDVRRTVAHRGEAFLTAGHRGHRVVARRKHPRERVANLRVVVDHEDRGFVGSHGGNRRNSGEDIID